VEHDCRGV